MPRRKPDADYVALHVQLPRDLVARLDLEADRRVLGRRLLIRRLLEDALDRLPPAETIFRSHSCPSHYDAPDGFRPCVLPDGHPDYHRNDPYQWTD